MKIKYPRTYHLPYSLTVTDDDKRLSSDDHFKSMDKVVSQREIIELFRECCSASEFKIKACIIGIEPQRVMDMFNGIVKSFWAGQWLSGQQNRNVTIEEFFAMKKSNAVGEGSYMNDLCKQMCYFIKYS